MNKISLIITVLNEEKTILDLLNSIVAQTKQPNEVIIVDGGSIDKTIEIIKKFSKKHSKLNLKIKIKKGNRSVGRNHAIKNAKNNLIAITDAGCVLDKNWLQELFNEYKKSNLCGEPQSKVPVIAGYYSSSNLINNNLTKKTLTNFQKAVVPYVLVMPDKVNPKTFLPATRSMLIEKNLFEKLSGFDEKLSDNEDYAFAKNLQKQKVKIEFAKKAVVFWQPRKNLKDFYNMIFRFARGDVFASIIRPKVILIFVRYVILTLLFLFSIKLFLAFLCFYSSWSIQKNKKYVGGGWVYLPLLQISSDIAVIHGSIAGFSQKRKVFIAHSLNSKQ